MKKAQQDFERIGLVFFAMAAFHPDPRQSSYVAGFPTGPSSRPCRSDRTDGRPSVGRTCGIRRLSHNLKSVIITQTPLRFRLPAAARTCPISMRSTAAPCAVRPSTNFCLLHCQGTLRRQDLRELVEEGNRRLGRPGIEHDLVREAMRKVGITKGMEISFPFGYPVRRLRSWLIKHGNRRRAACSLRIHWQKYPQPIASPARPGHRDTAAEQTDWRPRPIHRRTRRSAILSIRHPGKISKSQSRPAPRGTLEDLDNILMLFFTGKTRKADEHFVRAESQYCIEKPTH